MTDITPGQCPPHHWQLTALEIDGVIHDHHKCMRCGAQKDLPAGSYPTMFTERRPGDEEHRPAAEELPV